MRSDQRSGDNEKLLKLLLMTPFGVSYLKHNERSSKTLTEVGGRTDVSSHGLSFPDGSNKLPLPSSLPCR
eukprot:scaffold1019_cov123-Cylindrotheca_fusiformis.AAC.1